MIQRNFSNQYAFSPKKYLGQNFLIDKNIARRIVASARLTKVDNVLEVGPGLGALTFALASAAKRVVAVEKDKRLIEKIQNSKFKTQNLDSKIKIIQADILKIGTKNLRQWFDGEPYKVVANLPYNISSRFLWQFLACEYPPKEMVVMVQKEVAEKIVAKPGKMNLLSVAVQFYCRPRILFSVGRAAFYPSPKVDSAVVRLAEIKSPRPELNQRDFFLLVKAGFHSKRKQMKNNLQLFDKSADWPLILKNCGLNPAARAEELSVAAWLTVFKMRMVRKTSPCPARGGQAPPC